MAIENYENLGFQVNIDGADTVEIHLGKIVKRLKQIQQLNKVLGNIGGKSSVGGGSGTSTTKEKLSEEEKYAQRVAKQTQLLTAERYEDLRATELQNQALKRKLSYDLISNNNAVRSAEVEARIAQLRSQTAIQTELLANSEWQSLFAKQTQNRYQEQQIRQMARLQAEQKALNEGKWEEARRIELANQQRKKEIDQRLKQELGIKENTNSLKKYLAKLTSILVVARKVGRFISDAIQESASYVENLNLFAVAYGDVYQDTLDWALNLADSFGLANNEVVKFAGTFRQLSTSLGLVEDTANSVSQTVTQLGYDMSALFNTTVENAMEKLQSGLFSGNVRPLRAYGIDISQNQIDALFETNQALASLGVNARNLSQSDKVLARLIITLRDGSNAFGTMNREINTLQSQIRILQGSLSNFKLAIGDLVYEPTRQALVVVNAFIIAATNLIRILSPLKKEDKNNLMTGVSMGAEEASDAMDELNGKLADFDKFNVLGGQSQETTSSDITEALTNELAKQQAFYEQQVQIMDDIENEAKELAKALEPVVLAMGAIAIAWTINKITTTKKFMEALTTGVAKLTGSVVQLNKGMSLTNVLLVAGLIYSIMKAIEAFNNGDEAAGALAITMGVALVGAIILFNWETTKTIALKLKKWFTDLIPSIKEFIKNIKAGIKAMRQQAISAKQVGIALGAMVAAYFIADSVINAFGEEGRKTASICFLVAGGIMAVTAAVLALLSVISWGTALPILLASVGAAIAGVKGLTTEVKGFADGGYTNANLIMTHENGKREAIMKQGKSNVIMNDMQMTDIMEVAVAKGVVLGNKALGSQEGGNGQIIHNHIYLDGKQIYEGVTDTAKKYGNTWATV